MKTKQTRAALAAELTRRANDNSRCPKCGTVGTVDTACKNPGCDGHHPWPYRDQAEFVRLANRYEHPYTYRWRALPSLLREILGGLRYVWRHLVVAAAFTAALVVAKALGAWALIVVLTIGLVVFLLSLTDA